MKCPHCLDSFHDDPELIELGRDEDGDWAIIKRVCPSCKRAIFMLWGGNIINTITGTGRQFSKVNYNALIRPKIANRPPVPQEVLEEFARDYLEACLVLQDSPKSSAALGRRALQHIIREKANVKHGNLANEIQQVIDSGTLPSYLSESIDAVRNIGNFAVHPIKSQSVGEVVGVEPGEAEWTLDVIESLFDFYFVQPEILNRKRKALNARLKDSGKPEMKKP